VHPGHVNRFGILTDGDIFRNHGKMRTGISRAVAQRILTGILMFDQALLRHPHVVLARGRSERGIPLQRGQVLGGALTIDGIK